LILTAVNGLFARRGGRQPSPTDQLHRCGQEQRATAPAYPAVQPGETLTLAQVRRIQHAPHD
jgi:hypothetical protein